MSDNSLAISDSVAEIVGLCWPIGGGGGRELLTGDDLCLLVAHNGSNSVKLREDGFMFKFELGSDAWAWRGLGVLVFGWDWTCGDECTDNDRFGVDDCSAFWEKAASGVNSFGGDCV
mmetsp:Transcript_12342/g.15394  ORF Transcript_12342/g.15394 Transcript_12342/m.15394 type:complete len:117 (-) Transcript_12342:237-587(-)